MMREGEIVVANAGGHDFEDIVTWNNILVWDYGLLATFYLGWLFDGVFLGRLSRHTLG